jgi:hypothetical protein
VEYETLRHTVNQGATEIVTEGLKNIIWKQYQESSQ